MALTVLLLAVTLNFAVIRAAPGQYENRMAGQLGVALTSEDREALRTAYGLDQPLPIQFVRYVEQTFQGNFGSSFADSQPVRTKLWDAAKNSLSLAVVGVVAGMLLGILLGTIAGTIRARWIDTPLVAIASVVYSLPGQWIGMVLLALLAGPFPVGGREDIFASGSGFWAHQKDLAMHMALPSLTLALVTFGSYTLITRSSVLNVMGEDFIVTARAKGFTRARVMRREVLRNAMLPVLALAALSIGSIFGGALLIEVVFSWPGLGLLAYNAIGARDYPVIQATFLVVTAAIVFMNFLADCLYGVLDPRVRSE